MVLERRLFHHPRPNTVGRCHPRPEGRGFRLEFSVSFNRILVCCRVDVPLDEEKDTQEDGGEEGQTEHDPEYDCDIWFLTDEAPVCGLGLK